LRQSRLDRDERVAQSPIPKTSLRSGGIEIQNEVINVDAPAHSYPPIEAFGRRHRGGEPISAPQIEPGSVSLTNADSVNQVRQSLAGLNSLCFDVVRLAEYMSVNRERQVRAL
jgi:hypothetical protein